MQNAVVLVAGAKELTTDERNSKYRSAQGEEGEEEAFCNVVGLLSRVALVILEVGEFGREFVLKIIKYEDHHYVYYGWNHYRQL